MKKLLSILLLFLCIHLHAQPFTLKYIYQYSTATAPPTNYWLLLDPGNGQYQKSSIQSVGTVIGQFLQITNGAGTFSNVTVVTINSTTNIAQYSFLTNIYGPFITNFTLYSTNIFVTNLFASFITNNTFYSTNIFATNIVANNVYATSNFFTVTKGGTLIVTNASTTFQTNSTFITTNVTINAPGGLTNFNATPKTVAWWDLNDTLLSIPNGSGFLTNNGSGDIGWNTVLALTELDAQNAYLTNTFIFITNKFAYPDSNGQLTGLANASGVLQNDGSGGFSWVAAPAPGGAAGGELAGTYPNPTFAKLVVTNGENQAITVSNQFRVDATHAFVVSNSTASSLLSNDGAHNITNAGVSARMSFTGNVLDLAATPYANGINFTNEGFGLPTNNVGGAALVFGGPGTAATLYDTNITAATTLKLFDITACGATAGGIKLYCTCSGGTDRILTFPAGCSGAGLGTPPAVTITNAKGAFFDVIYKPGATPVTNVFWSPVY